MKHILFPVDFSDPCDGMAPAVALVARAFDARLSIMNVAQPPAVPEDFAPFRDHWGTMFEELGGALRRYRRDDFEGLAVDYIVETGSPAPEIAEYARSAAVDLIMMPSHGLSRFRRLLLGSVTASVLHDSDCPVLTAAHAAAGQTWRALPRSIVCAVDLGPSSAGVAAAARRFGSVCAVSPVMVHASFRPAEDIEREYAGIMGNGAPAGRIEVMPADPVSAIVDAAIRHGADLLVIGRGKATGILGRLRGTAHDLIRLSPCPVLSV